MSTDATGQNIRSCTPWTAILVAVAIDLSEQVLQRLTEWSQAIPKKTVNSFGTGGQDESFATDLAVGSLLACGRAFISLLHGELPPGMTDGHANDPT